MSAKSEKKYKLKGHESFYIRDGWLRKGMKNVKAEPGLFGVEDVVDRLAVGANMVKAIRFWLQAGHLTVEKIQSGSKRVQKLTSDFGEIIIGKDPYFEDIFTLWIVHYFIAANNEMCTSWYLFFNKFALTEFSKEELVEGMQQLLEDYIGHKSFSQGSLKDDCGVILKTYFEEDMMRDPEDNLICPLSELGLIKQKKDMRGKSIYCKTKPSIEKLHPLVIMYGIVRSMEDTNGMSVDLLLERDNSVGKLFNLDRAMIYYYLEELKRMGLVEINRTAGLDMIYPAQITSEQVLAMYYDGL